jgi:hypothetical protein
MFTSIFGTVVEMKQMSTKDRLERKKYMGVWRCESELTARMMRRFPSTAPKYINRNSPNKNGSNSRSSERHKSKNRGIDVLFSPSISPDFFP